ncbi:hypothetical protein [Bowmanella denitrificans]|uniref:hypothetical protein n=1 Tax=Bowmanella denitrificans TaxID=366582 RepID=UPI000C9BA4CB|nr:hypothetical protein [Bowmanella denitrificans]
MQRITQQAKATLVSLSILSMALALLWLGQGWQAKEAEQLTIREVSVAMLPPPPPPPTPVQQVIADAPINLQVSGSGPSIQLTKPDVLQLTAIQPPAPVMQMARTDWQSLEVDWQAFSLDELDGLPTLLTPLSIRLPASLSRQGIKQVLIKLEILVDEQGQVTLLDVVENPHPELKPEILKMVRSSRFSAPSKGNETVRAKFIWPINISE